MTTRIEPAVVRGIADEMIAGLVQRARVQPIGLAGETRNSARQRYGRAGATLRDVARELVAMGYGEDGGSLPHLMTSAFSSGLGTELLTGVANTVFVAAYK